MSGIDWSPTPAAYSIDREQLDALLSRPYNEPDMDDVERVCDEVRHEPVLRTLCLALSDDLSMPLQCRFRLGHPTRHDWQIEPNVMSEGRAERLREEQDTPSGRLPVRTPGAALRDEEGSDGPGGPGQPVRSLASAFPREVLGTWTV